MNRCAGGGIMRSSDETRYQLGLLRQAGSPTAPLRASGPHGTCEAAMNAAFGSSTSAANDWANLARSSSRKPSGFGTIGGTGAPGGGALISEPTDSPASGANAAI